MIKNIAIMMLDKRLYERSSYLHNNIEQLMGYDLDVCTIISGDGVRLKDQPYYNVDPNPNDHTDIRTIEFHKQWHWGTGVSAWRHYCAFLTHKQIIKLAIKNKWDNFLLLEDDAVFTSRFYDVMEKIYPQVPSQWDIIYLGWHAFEYDNHRLSGKNLEIENEYKKTGLAKLETIQQCGGLFATWINSSMYNRILAMPPIAPVDSQLNYYRNEIISLNVVPMAMYTAGGFSHCENTFIERDVL